jgi:predicted phosphodiesterase
MAAIMDSIFELFLYFRLGKADPERSQVLYYSADTGASKVLDVGELPHQEEGTKRIVVVSDTHDRYRGLNLPAGDVFIHAGDIFMTGRIFSDSRGNERIEDFNQWLEGLDFKSKIVIGGNHDKPIERAGLETVQQLLSNAIYLENQSVVVDSLTVFGCPLSRGHSSNCAFQSEDFVLKTKNDVINVSKNGKLDILITHGPNFKLAKALQPQLHVFGHAHALHGVHERGRKLDAHICGCLTVNGSIMNTKYNPHNLPVVVDILFT